MLSIDYQEKQTPLAIPQGLRLTNCRNSPFDCGGVLWDELLNSFVFPKMLSFRCILQYLNVGKIEWSIKYIAKVVPAKNSPISVETGYINGSISRSTS